MTYIKKADMIKMLGMLKDVKRVATMNNCMYRDTKTEENNKTIKELTKLWRETWIISPVEAVIMYLEVVVSK